MLKKFLNIIARVIFNITPKEFLLKKPKTIYQMYSEEETVNCYNHFKEYFKKAIFLDSPKEIRKYTINKAVLKDVNKDGYYLEFGVFIGTSTNLFADYVHKIYGFDSFEGLKEDWVSRNKPKGHFNLNRKPPKVKPNVELVIGWVQNTLEVFLKKNKPIIRFVHMDMDTYETSKYILDRIKPYLAKNSLILFDELYNFEGWEVGEYKALKETFNENEYAYRAFQKNGRIVAIEIL